jgi:hypothetical protein
VEVFPYSLASIERKSGEPMSARLAPGKLRRMHRSLHRIAAETA